MDSSNPNYVIIISLLLLLLPILISNSCILAGYLVFPTFCIEF
jgi:hypothetical protein